MTTAQDSTSVPLSVYPANLQNNPSSVAKDPNASFNLPANTLHQISNGSPSVSSTNHLEKDFVSLALSSSKATGEYSTTRKSTNF